LAELLLRAGALAERTLGELASALGVLLPDDPRRGKGIPGQLIERALGAAAGGAPVPDFEALGVELKTVPTDENGRPRESTFVCSIAALEIQHEEWESSRVRKKLRHVLWVPISAEPAELAARRIGVPRLWRPCPDDEAVLRADWEELAGLCGAGAIDEISGTRGRFLQVRPKAADSRARTFAQGPDDTTISALPRGFYLRACFTARILKGES
jgi:DNA mismatch repair protein MutH